MRSNRPPITTLRLGPQDYRLYVGTSAIKRDIAWLHRHLEPNQQVSINDETEAYAVLGLMGPDSARIAHRLGATELNDLAYFQHCPAEIGGVPVEAARLSYVGEAGWELTCAVNQALALFDALLNAGARPAGIFAQTSMRTEKRFLAYGHDLDTDTDPFQAGLDFAIDWDSSFIGKQALLPLRDNEPKSRMVTIVLDDPQAIPLGNEPVYLDGSIIGKTTSAAFGYRIGKPVAIAQIETSPAQPLADLAVEVDIARSKFSGTISLTSVYDPKGQRMRSYLQV